LALTVGATTAVAGCSPPARVNSAVYLRDGKPTVVVHLCGSKDRLTGLRLQEEAPEPVPSGSDPAPSGSDPAPSGSGPTASATPNLLRSWNVARRSGPGYAEIRLLDTPPGWTVTSSPDFVVTELRDDQRYWVEVEYRSSNGGTDRGVAFTMDDLRSLGTGEVWAKPNPYEREAPMTLDAFRRAARDAC
jgi:hypothetical protein